jgi:hypothetical protein
MAYDVHIVSTKDWFEASKSPITKEEVNVAIAGDPELEWAVSDYIEMADASGAIQRIPLIAWKGVSCFCWCKDQITCSGPAEQQIIKLCKLAQALNAYVVGDDGERYELRKSFLGREKLITLPVE